MSTRARVVKQDDLGAAPPEDGLRWRSVEQAAAFLGMPVRVLREALARNARAEGGVVEARLDGITARKLGRQWRVWLDPGWLNPHCKK